MADSMVKPRPIVRLVVLLMSHRVIVSFLCCFAAVIALLLLPALAKNTYFSENALMPGSVTSMLSRLEVSEASNLVSDIMELDLEAKNSGREIPILLADYIASLGAEVGQFQSYPQLNKFQPLNFFSNSNPGLIQGNMTCAAHAISTFGIIRAPRGDGKEAIVLVTPYNASGTDSSEVLSLGVAYSVFSLLTKVTWLAKDIIWLAADSRYGEYDAVSAWLREYFSPSFGVSGKAFAELNVAKSKGGFRRAGTMAAALVIKVVNDDKNTDDTLSIYAEATNGQMPNLDLINVVNYLAVHRQGLRVKLANFWSVIGSKYIGIVGQTIECVGKIAGTLNPDWRFGIPAAEYAEGTATLASSLYAQALGIPTGSHGAFRDYQIDAVTLAMSQKISLHNTAKRSEFLMRSGRLIEGVIRSVNNLLEKFHHSFFLYLLTSPSKYVSVGVYMIAFALLIAPLPVVAASLYSETTKTDSTATKSEKPSSWKWLPAAKSVFIVHSWAVIVSLLPYFISEIPNQTPKTSLFSWVSLSLCNLQVFYLLLGSPTSLDRHEWPILKSVMISAAFIGLCLMSIVNYATAQIGALLLVPLCLMAQPLRSDLRARSLKTYARAACNVVLGFVGFPPAAFFVLKGVTTGSLSVAYVWEFWMWAESLWRWNSATYVYMVLVHLPCWVMCVHVLFHPC